MHSKAKCLTVNSYWLKFRACCENQVRVIVQIQRPFKLPSLCCNVHAMINQYVFLIFKKKQVQGKKAYFDTLALVNILISQLLTVMQCLRTGHLGSPHCAGIMKCT